MAGKLREHLGRATAMAAGRSPRRRWPARCALLARRVRRGRRRLRRRAEVPAVDGAGVPAPARRSEPDADGTLEAMARGGIYDQLGGGFARYSVDARWVVPHFEKMLYDNAQLLGLYARVGGPLGDRVARRDRRLPARASCAPPRAASPRRWTPTARASRASSTPGRPPQLVEALGPDDGAWAAQVLRGDRGRHLRARHAPRCSCPVDPEGPGAARLADVRAAAARRACARGSGRPATTRWSRPGTGWRSPGSATPGCGSASRRTSTRRSPPATLLWRVHVVDGRLRRVSATAWSGAPAGRARGPRLRGVRLPRRWCRRTGDAVWLDRAPALLDEAIERFRADDGGFFDTAADAEALVARPRDPADNASPSGLSSMVHALVDAHALTGEGRYRQVAEEALATVATPGREGAALRRLVAGRGADAWWPAGRSRSRSSGPPGRSAPRSRARARQHPGAVVVEADGPRDDVPAAVRPYAASTARPRRTSAGASSASGRSPPSRSWTAR